MSDDTPVSPLRRVLCSQSNAVRVAGWITRGGIDTAIVATGNPLQPWLIIDATAAMEGNRACA